MKNVKTISVPKLGEIDPTYAEIEAKRIKAMTERSSVQKDIDKIHAKMRDDKRSPQRVEQDARIARYTGDDSHDIIDDGRANLPALMQKVSDLDRVVQIFEAKLMAERGVASKLICERVKPEYARRVASVCSKMIELNSALAAYQEVVFALQANDVAFSGALRPMLPHWVGHPNDRNGRIASHLREAAEYGLYDKAAIPAELR